MQISSNNLPIMHELPKLFK